MKVLVRIKSDSFKDGVMPMRREFTHDDVYVLTERDDKHVLIKRGGGELEYPAKLYEVKEI